MNVAQRIVVMVAQQLDVDVEDVQIDAVLTALGATSIDIYGLFIAIEDEFSVKVPDAAVVHTVQDLIDLVPLQ